MSIDQTNPSLRLYADIMHAGNADLMLRLSNMVSIPLSDIAPPLRLTLIAGLRERHTTMPAGREISDLMQASFERALIQGRLYLMRMPGAAEGFRVAAAQYSAEFSARRDLAQHHLNGLEKDAISSLGAIEWCERLVTKFTPQEIARHQLPDYAARLETIHDRLTRFDPAVGDVLRCTIALLQLGNDVSINAVDRVRQNLPDFAITVPAFISNQMPRVASAR